MADNEKQASSTESGDKTTDTSGKQDTAKSSGEKSPEALLSSVRSESVADPEGASGNQLPTTITGFRDDPVYQHLTPTLTATPISPLDGGDGSHTTVVSKTTDYVWKPFVAPKSFPMEADFNTDGTIWFDTPATQTQDTANDTAAVAANALTKF